ncbi:MAG: TRAP transporter small permease [Christensenellales bacterium]
MKTLHKVSDVLDKITLVIIGLLLTEMTVVYFAQVVARFAFNSGLYWSEEMVRYSCVVMIYLASASLFKRGGHVAITVLEEMLPRKARKYHFILMSLVSLVYMALVLVIGIQIMGSAVYQMSPNMRIPMNFIYLLFPISAVLMIIHTLSNLTDPESYRKFSDATQGEVAK